MVKMLRIISVFCVCLFAAASVPANLILRKLDPALRYQHERDSIGQYHLVDTWMTLSDLAEVARYNPVTDNVYHLFTRENPTVSQPMYVNSAGLLQGSNYSNGRRTIVIIHGWRDGPISDSVVALIPAFLAAEDLNVFVVDWTAASNSINYPAVLSNTITSGLAVGQFINWVNQVTGSNAVQYHIVGHGLGGHQAGIAARNVNGEVAYVTGLDPSLVGWINHSDRFGPDDGSYTEVIHTNCGVNGYIADLAQVDFYPNGGESMPGCDSHACDHSRSYFYFAESITSGGFTGRQCVNYLAAVLQTCNVLPGTLQMGGLRPKFGSSGVYLVWTNASPPFSMD
ncbi:pancreatic triacylglycerol lipase-like isoform X2 [Plodia interpunctella]|uniref:pancreatic triacylglycerol lipase-like isoform X2 n=1 Tax=Plodia interpunctella TaxID=58824 RepID=UPI00236885BD|nr:pancreatic triacylglycerol lipase-like isoform X2 [Plodia interpunctella]